MTVLPFHKRTARHEDAEDLLTSDIVEVIRPAQRGGQMARQELPRPPADRPRVFQRHDDDEVTCLMPTKSATLPPPPNGAAARVPMARPAAGMMIPRMARQERDEHTSYRPTQPPADAQPMPMHVRMNGGVQASPFQPRAFAPQQQLGAMHPVAHMVPRPPDSVAPVAMNATVPSTFRVGNPPSDPRIDPPATVITTRTKVLTGRPTVSWAAALVAMGVFAGLVTAVLARGDGDAVVDATASFVDPSHQGKPGAAPTAVAATQAPAMPSTPDVVAAPAAPPAPVAPAPMAASDTGPILGPTSTFAYAKPSSAPSPFVASVAAAPAPKPEKKVEAAPAPAPRVAKAAPPPAPKAQPKVEKEPEQPKAERVVAKKRGAAGSDADAEAAAAKKLADDQLNRILGN